MLKAEEANKLTAKAWKYATNGRKPTVNGIKINMMIIIIMQVKMRPKFD